MNVVLMALAVAGAVDNHLHPRQMRLEVRVCQGDPLGSRAAGTVRYIAEPSLLVASGRQAYFRAGGVGDGAGQIRQDGQGWFGVSILVTPIRYPNGKVWAEISATDCRVGHGLGLPGRPGIKEQTWRHSLFLTPGEPFRFRISADSPESQTWAEVTVRDEPPAR